MHAVLSQIGFAFWRLLPGNPIVIRVVKGGSKSVPHLWVRTAYLVVLFLLVVFASLGVSSGASLGQRAKESARIFELVSILQLVMTCLLAPVFAASAISQERDAETFNVLLTTPLTNAQIALGSLMSRLFFVVALLLAGLPVFCITMLFGGVTADRIFVSFGIAVCTAVLASALAITMSVTKVGVRGTIFSFYMGIALFVLAGLALGMWPKTYVPETVVPGGGMSWLAPFHPFLAQFVALHWVQAPDVSVVQHYPWPLPFMLSSPDTAYMIVTLLLSVVLMMFSTFFVRIGSRQREPIWLRLMRKLRRSSGIPTERMQRARRVWSNPVAWREAITRASAATSNLVRYTFLLGGMAAGVLVIGAYANKKFVNVAEARAWLSTIVIIEFVTVLFMTINSAATAITREREAGTMELLLVTPLTSRYIIWGKLRGLLSFALRLQTIPALTVLAAAIYSLIVEYTSPSPLMRAGSVIALIPLLVVYSAFTCVIGLQTSLKSTRSLPAVLVSIGTLVVVAFILGSCGFNLSNTGETEGLLAPLTFVMGIWIVLNPSSPNLEPFAIVGALLALGVYGAIAVFTYKAMVKNFDMIVRKQMR